MKTLRLPSRPLLLAAVVSLAPGCALRSAPPLAAAPPISGAACSADRECPAVAGPCMVSVCADGRCQPQVATAGTVPAAQTSGDCEQLVCDGKGGAVARGDVDDTPADDGNACTEEVCSPSGPDHAPLVAGAPCGDRGVCNGKGRCGVCLPAASRCEKNAAQTCSGEGQWSPPTTCDQGTPICVEGRCAVIKTIALGRAHGCVLVDSGASRCWGAKSAPAAGELIVVPQLDGASALALGDRHRCALLGDGTVRCWGNNLGGELGDGSSQGHAAATPVIGVEGATQIAAGAGHTCARLVKGDVVCWGHDEKGQLGVAGAPPVKPTEHPQATTRAPSFVAIPPAASMTTPFTAIALGGDATCGVRVDRKVACRGELAIEASPIRAETKVISPRAPKLRLVTGVKNAIAVALGGDHSCALLADGSALCWGDNERGQLGDGSPAKKHPPAKVKALAGAAELALGRDHTCARLRDGAVSCWGSNSAGQLGDGSTTDRRVPTAVPGISGATAIVAAGDRTCARLDSGAVLCWGDDADGAIRGARPAPTAVAW